MEQRIICWVIVWLGSHSGCGMLIEESWQRRRIFCSQDSNGYKQYSHALRNTKTKIISKFLIFKHTEYL